MAPKCKAPTCPCCYPDNPDADFSHFSAESVPACAKADEGGCPVPESCAANEACMAAQLAPFEGRPDASNAL
jgi:hypothetical protein